MFTPREGIEPSRGKAPQAFQACALAARLPRHDDFQSIQGTSYHSEDFMKFLQVQKNLSDSTVENHLRNAKVFSEYINDFTVEEIQRFLSEIKKERSAWTYKNYLATLKILFRDYLKKPELIQDFKFPTHAIKPRIPPSREQLKTFFAALPSMKYKIIFLILASSGLRISELLSADIDTANRMLIPKSHDGNTKQSWISFYNMETEALLKQYEGNPFETSRNTVAHVFKDVSRETGIDISAQTLRSVFAKEMSMASVQDRYIDAFCGRTPQSVLARHYSDFSPEVLKEVYKKANIKILMYFIS